MKQVLEFAPVLVFVAVFFAADIYAATAALMVAVAAQIVVYKLARWPVTRQMWFVFWVALIAGGTTLFLRDPIFIMWKPTVVCWLMGAGILASRYVGRRDYIERALGGTVTLSSRAWGALTWIWSGCFVLAGVANLYVAYEFSEQAWVAYKLTSMIGLPILLIVASSAWLVLTGEFREDGEAGQAPSGEAEG